MPMTDPNDKVTGELPLANPLTPEVAEQVREGVVEAVEQTVAGGGPEAEAVRESIRKFADGKRGNVRDLLAEQQKRANRQVDESAAPAAPAAPEGVNTPADAAMANRVIQKAVDRAKHEVQSGRRKVGADGKLPVMLPDGLKLQKRKDGSEYAVFEGRMAYRNKKPVHWTRDQLVFEVEELHAHVEEQRAYLLQSEQMLQQYARLTPEALAYAFIMSRAQSEIRGKAHAETPPDHPDTEHAEKLANERINVLVGNTLAALYDRMGWEGVPTTLTPNRPVAGAPSAPIETVEGVPAPTGDVQSSAPFDRQVSGVAAGLGVCPVAVVDPKGERPTACLEPLHVHEDPTRAVYVCTKRHEIPCDIETTMAIDHGDPHFSRIEPMTCGTLIHIEWLPDLQTVACHTTFTRGGEPAALTLRLAPHEFRFTTAAKRPV